MAAVLNSRRYIAEFKTVEKFAAKSSGIFF